MRIYGTAGVFMLALYAQAVAVGQVSFWMNSTIPGTTQVTNDTSSVTLGLKVYSDVAGSITGIRFYKGPNNTGTHIGTLWSNTGTKLAEITFSGETASGWQQGNFPSPVNIAANTTYIVSYLAPKGSYADDQNFSWSNVSATPLHVSGSAPGVFAYGSSTLFPSGAWNASNYWVDPVFVAGSSPIPSGPSSSVWPTSTIPGTMQVTNDTSSVTLGLKVFSDVPGSVTGIRFYKGQNNTGTHVGTLWSNTGTRLAEITFSGETASGWQQGNFPSPVNIAANTTYIVSYLAPKGSYADDQNYPWSNVSSTPLHVSGSAPGVFAYGPSTAFPTGTWISSNYWVDLVFAPATPSGPSVLYSVSGQVSGSAATLTLSGTASGSTTTDATGKYSFSNLANGSYVVAPSHAGFAFAPSTAAMTINGAALTGVNFTATAVPVPVSHTVTLSWIASVSPNVIGYNVYRATSSGGPYAKVNGSPVGATTYLDSNVSSGQSYFYVATTVDSSNHESAYSTQATAIVPTP
jgi:hypothetical protein